MGESSSRNLVPLDTQWVAISLDIGKTYSVETTGLNPLVYVYDSLRASTYRVCGKADETTYTPIRTGYFLIKITGTSTATTGNFTFMVTDNDMNNEYRISDNG